MDRGDLEHLEKKLETTIEIIMESLRDFHQQLDGMQTQIDEVRDGVSQHEQQ